MNMISWISAVTTKRTLAVGIALITLCGGNLAAWGSFKFKDVSEPMQAAMWQSLDYGDLISHFEGQTQIKVAFWVDLEQDTGTQTIFSMIDDNGDNGIKCFYNNTRFWFFAENGEDDSVVIKTNTGTGEADDGWAHVAFHMDMQRGETVMRAWVNGTLQDDQVDDDTVLFTDGLVFDQFESDKFYIGRVPAATGFEDYLSGHVHDLFIGEGTWSESETEAFGDPSETPLLTAEPASEWVDDFSTDRLFYALLRNNAKVDVGPFPPDDVTPTEENGPLTKSMGPPLDYPDTRSRILVIGDTQDITTNANAELLEITGEFISDHRDSLNIAAVIHVGDHVNNTTEGAQVVRARDFVDRFIEDNIPFAMTMGNHDVDFLTDETPGTPPLRGYTDLGDSEALPMTLVNFDDEPKQSWFIEEMVTWDSGEDDGEYLYLYEFDLGATKLELGICVPVAPTIEMLEWVVDTAAEYPDRRVWLSTHVHTNTASYDDDTHETYFDDERTTPLNSDEIWCRYYSKIPNLAFVLCGHWHSRLLVHFSDSGCAGNSVENLRVDNQSAPDGGAGFMAILTINLLNTEINVEAYRPGINEFDSDKDNTFDLDLPDVPVASVRGDFDGDGDVDCDDWDALVACCVDEDCNTCPDPDLPNSMYGSCCFDLNEDCVVDALDLILFGALLGGCP